MKLEAGKWYMSDGGRKWHVDFVGALSASAHDLTGNVIVTRLDGGGDGFGFNIDLISEWTEPKLRPWKMEEVPTWAWYRHKSNHRNMFWPSEVNDQGIVIAGVKTDYELLAFGYEFYSDNKCWLPCGVME